MAAETRSVRVPCYAKINLDLKVLNKGADGYHELRTVFQTVTLADELEISFTPARRTELTIDSAIDIPDNLVLRAARAVLDASRVTGLFHCKLHKKIPMGGGLGGGSTDAASVLLALPVLTGRTLPLERLMDLGAALGSDVPFFLLGGTALGFGRGTELYPLPESPEQPLLIVAPPIHVSTPEAYAAFDRGGNGKLTQAEVARYIGSFQSRVWGHGKSLSPGGSGSSSENDFERVVFPRHPALKSTLNKLKKLGAAPARMTGSGAALYGFFRSREEVKAAAGQFDGSRVYPAATLSRRRYHASWWRALKDHMDVKTWPPPSRYAR